MGGEELPLIEGKPLSLPLIIAIKQNALNNKQTKCLTRLVVLSMVQRMLCMFARKEDACLVRWSRPCKPVRHNCSQLFFPSRPCQLFFSSTAVCTCGCNTCTVGLGFFPPKNDIPRLQTE